MPTSVNMEEIRQRISVINAQSAQVNNTRSVNLGRKQTLESQLENLLKTYNAKYGVQLTPETLEEEINKVANEKNEEYNKLSGVLEAINNQDYARANQLLGIQVEEQVKEVVSPVVNTNQEEVTNVPVNEQTVMTPPVVEQPIPNSVVEETVATPPVVTTPVVQQEVVPPTPVTPTPVAPPVMEQPVVAPPMGMAVTPPSGFVAPPVGVPTSPTGNLMGAQDFMAGVQEQSKAPMPALEGFTKGFGGLSGLDTPNLDVAPPNPQPKSFGDILGGNNFQNS